MHKYHILLSSKEDCVSGHRLCGSSGEKGRSSPLLAVNTVSFDSFTLYYENTCIKTTINSKTVFKINYVEIGYCYTVNLESLDEIEET